jgi:hypothetical protein
VLLPAARTRTYIYSSPNFLVVVIATKHGIFISSKKIMRVCDRKGDNTEKLGNAVMYTHF